MFLIIYITGVSFYMEEKEQFRNKLKNVKVFWSFKIRFNYPFRINLIEMNKFCSVKIFDSQMHCT